MRIGLHIMEPQMKKLLCATVASAFLFTATFSNTASAVGVAPAPMPMVGAGTSAAAGVTATGVFIGVAGGLVLYDVLRRWTPMPDWLHLGGPDFRMMRMMMMPPRQQINAMPPLYNKAINY